MRTAKKRLPKSNRKARRLRINLSGSGFGGMQFRPNDECWAELEQALEQQISQQVRLGLTEIVQEYFSAQPIESSSPFLDDVLASVARIKKGAIELRATLQNPDDTNKAVRLIVGRNCQIRGVKPGLAQLDMLNRALTSLINASSQSERYFSIQPGFEEGDEWGLMIRRVRKLFRDHGLRSGASQDSSSGSRSKFVVFIETLQRHFPDPSLRRHYGIDSTALAKQINRVDRRRDIKPRASVG